MTLNDHQLRKALAHRAQPDYTDAEVRRQNMTAVIVEIAVFCVYIAFLAIHRAGQPAREARAREAGIAKAEAEAAAVGGWQNWCQLDVDKHNNKKGE